MVHMFGLHQTYSFPLASVGDGYSSGNNPELGLPVHKRLNSVQQVFTESI